MNNDDNKKPFSCDFEDCINYEPCEQVCSETKEYYEQCFYRKLVVKTTLPPANPCCTSCAYAVIDTGATIVCGKTADFVKVETLDLCPIGRWGFKKPTKKQLNYISQIEEELDIGFEGTTREDATIYIRKHQREFNNKLNKHNDPGKGYF